jgi:hypothetical protein
MITYLSHYQSNERINYKQQSLLGVADNHSAVLQNILIFMETEISTPFQKCLQLNPIPSHFNVRGSFEKFVDSTYYSESEICGGAMTVFFSKYLPWQGMHLL